MLLLDFFISTGFYCKIWDNSIATVSVINGKLIVTPIINANGVVIIEVNATANELTATQTFTLDITAVDDVPVLTTISNSSDRDEDFSDFNISLSSSDVENNSVVYNASSNDKVNVQIVNNNILQISSKANVYGEASIDINVTQENNSSLFDTQKITFTINSVNDKPTFDTNLSSITISEDNGTLNFELNATDIEGSSLTISVESNNTNLLTISPSWDMNNSINQATYSQPLDFNITTVQDANGVAKITIVVSDGELNTTKIYDINVSAMNDAPVLTELSNLTKDEDFSDFNITLSATDIEGDLIIYTAESNNTSIATVSVNGNSLTIHSVLKASGIVGVTVTARDEELSDSKLFYLYIQPAEITEPESIYLSNNEWIDNKSTTKYLDNVVFGSTEGVNFIVSQKASALSSAQIYTPMLNQIVEASAKLTILQTGTNASGSFEMVDTNPNYANAISIKSKIEVFEKQIVASIYRIDESGESYLIHSENIFDFDANKSFVDIPLYLNIWIENGLNFSVTNTNHNQVGRVVTYDFRDTGYTPIDFESSYVSGTIDATQTGVTASFAMTLKDVLFNQTLQKQFMKDFAFMSGEISASDYANEVALAVTAQTLFDIKTIENSTTKYLDLETKQFVMGTSTNYFAITVTNQNNIVQTITKEKEEFIKNGEIFVTSNGEKKFIQELSQSALNSLFVNNDINITFSTGAVGYKVYEKVGAKYKSYYLFNNIAALDLVNSLEFSKNATKTQTISTLWTYLSIPVNKPLCVNLYKTTLNEICNQEYSIE